MNRNSKPLIMILPCDCNLLLLNKVCVYISSLLCKCLILNTGPLPETYTTLGLFTCSGSVSSSARRTDTQLCHSLQWHGISGSHRWSAGRSSYGSFHASWHLRCWCTPCCSPPASRDGAWQLKTRSGPTADTKVSVCKDGFKKTNF